MGQAAARRRAGGDKAVAPGAGADSDRALRRCVELVRQGTTSPDVYNDLGALLAARGSLAPAVVQLEMALALAPGHADARRNLQKALESMSLAAFQERRWADAAAGYTRLCALEPASAVFHNNAGAALRELGQLERALPHLRAAREHAPANATIHYNLGSALYELGQREAEAALRRAIELDPEHVDAHVNLALVYDRLGELSAAATLLRRALALAPAHGEAHGNLATVLREQGDLAASLAHFRRAMELRPAARTIHSSYLLARHADPAAAPADLLDEHRAWADRFAAGLDPGPARDFAGRSREPGRRLRVAYLSPDLRRHSVAAFVEPIIAAHDRAALETFCYSDAVPDAVTERIRAHADGWRDTRGLDDAALAARILADEIDVLVDLAGHTAGNRLLVLARRPAPVQVSYCGYPGTTGLAAIEWRLTDALADPPESDSRPAPAGDGDGHEERLWRLPHGFLCFLPDAEAPPVAAPPSASAPGGAVTFGSFNNLSKVGPPVISAWAEVLRAVPGSHLLLKSRALTDREPRERLSAAFATAGVDPARVRFSAYATAPLDHLALYREVDVALDPFPYNGATTTCEALWMGVPVVTLAGRSHVGRVGSSLLARAGLPELVAASPADYVEIATRLAADPERRRALRHDLRNRLQSSPLTSAPTIARDLEHAYREMWRRWCARKP